MTSIPLTTETIKEYMGYDSSSIDVPTCQEISQIHLEHDTRANRVRVFARIPAVSASSSSSSSSSSSLSASTSSSLLFCHHHHHHQYQGQYDISIYVRPDKSEIVLAYCTCPKGGKCEHIDKVLHRIAASSKYPIEGPTKAYLAEIGGPSPAYLAELARRRELAKKKIEQQASVYIAFTSKSDLDGGSDDPCRSFMYYKENFDQQILGIFFSRVEANKCAKEYLRNDLGYKLYDNNDDDDDDIDNNNDDNDNNIDVDGVDDDDDDDGHDDDMDEDSETSKNDSWDKDSDDDNDNDNDDNNDNDDGEWFVWDGSDYGEFCNDYPNSFPKVWVERRTIQDASSNFHR